MSDATAAMARVRMAIAKTRETGGGFSADAVEALADIVDGLISALNAEPGLRIDYERVDAPAKPPRPAAPRET